jgi:GWxTD domain-containing protein
MYYQKLIRLFTLLLVFMHLAAKGLALDAGYSYAIYWNTETPYVEVNFEIAAASIYFKKIDSTQMQAGVEVMIIFKQGERVANYEKFQLNSPVLRQPLNMLDSKRFVLENGAYDVEMIFIDINDRNNKREINFAIVVDIQEKPYLSELQLLRSFKRDESESPFTKNGFYLEPLPFHFYNRDAQTIAFYAEIYHSNKFASEPYLVRYFIEELSGNAFTRLAAVGSQRKQPAQLDAVLAQMAIGDLPSGNYRFNVELRDNQNQVVCKRSIEFQRSNPPIEPFIAGKITEEELTKQFVEKLSAEDLHYALRAIGPVVPQNDAEALKNVLAGKDPKAMRFLLFNHFVKINQVDPEAAYLRYIEVAKAVDKLYNSGFGYGFESDRGTIFMRYGRPADIVKVEDDPSAPPYEIWVYYDFPVTKQSNVKFLFYNQSLSPGDYALLHSTARGERNNQKWERDLYQKSPTEFDSNNGSNYHDATQMVRNNARNARALFNDL